jgi:hypothetical protein
MGKRNRLYNEANVLPDSLELNDEFVGTFNLIRRRTFLLPVRPAAVNQLCLNI